MIKKIFLMALLFLFFVPVSFATINTSFVEGSTTDPDQLNECGGLFKNGSLCKSFNDADWSVIDAGSGTISRSDEEVNITSGDSSVVLHTSTKIFGVSNCTDVQVNYYDWTPGSANNVMIGFDGNNELHNGPQVALETINNLCGNNFLLRHNGNTVCGNPVPLNTWVNVTICQNATVSDGVIYQNNTDSSALEALSSGGQVDPAYFTILVQGPDVHTFGFRGIQGYGISGIPQAPENNGPSQITHYNLTSEGGEGCTVWNTNKNTPCVTSDTTPTIPIKLDVAAACRIGVTDSNYTAMGGSRNCTGGTSGSLTCTLTSQDELTVQNSKVFIACDNGFQNSSSTSGGLAVTILSTDLETRGRAGIESGIASALDGGYTLFTDKPVYVRNTADNQSFGVYDKVVKWMNKIWAFNVITGNDTFIFAVNITPTFFNLEMANMTQGDINLTVFEVIEATK